MTILFCFDRDGTVDVSRGPVPLDWVQYLAHETEHIVYAHGNARLTREADIPHAHDLKADEAGPHAARATRLDRLRAIAEHVGDTVDRKIAVDDTDVSELEAEGWDYYRPRAFVDAFRGQGELS